MVASNEWCGVAKKTNLSFSEVDDLLMVSPLRLFEWVQQGRLHAQLEDGFDTVFTRDDIRYFAQTRGLGINRPDKNKLRILIIDSDRQLTNSLVNLFDTLSETVEATAVHSAYEAGQRLQSENPDIVLMDLMLQNQDDIEMCRRIKSDRSTRHIRLVTMSNQVDGDLIQRSLMLGAEACLAKPVDHQKLFEVLGLCMDMPREPVAGQIETYQ